MGLIKTKGIVTKIVNYSDNDKILTVITAELGKIQLEIDNSNNIENLELEKQKELKLKEIRKQYNILFIEKEIDRY